MAYIGVELIKITDDAENDPSVRHFAGLIDNYLEFHFDDPSDSSLQPPEEIESVVKRNRRYLIESKTKEFCSTAGITNMYFYSDAPKQEDYIVIHTGQKFDLEKLAQLVPFLKGLQEKDFVYRVAHTIDGDPDEVAWNVYSLYVLRRSAFEEALSVGTEKRLRTESIYVDSDGELSYPKDALSNVDEREIIDTLAERLFGLKETQ